MIERTWMVAVVVALVACSSEEKSSSGELGPAEYRADFESSSEFFTRMSKPADSGSVHGTVRIWYSANVADIDPASSFEVPEGTVAIRSRGWHTHGSCS